MYDTGTLKSVVKPADTRARAALWMRGPECNPGEVPLKARLFRATVAAAMLAAVVQSFGAAIKW